MDMDIFAHLEYESVISAQPSQTETCYAKNNNKSRQKKFYPFRLFSKGIFRAIGVKGTQIHILANFLEHTLISVCCKN